jgi:cytochrome c oxidase subunit 3
LTGGALIEYAGARKALGWLAVTLVLGFAFCVGQYMVWQQLRAAGIYLATNPNSSFFYVLTVIHALHVLAGIIALVYLMGRLVASHSTFRRSFFENTAIYWHFMGVLWVYLFLLCRTKL